MGRSIVRPQIRKAERAKRTKLYEREREKLLCINKLGTKNLKLLTYLFTFILGTILRTLGGLLSG